MNKIGSLPGLLETKMQTLNSLVWPEIARLAKEEIRKHASVKRLEERNKLSEEETLKRIRLRITKNELMQKSNVVLCSQWEYEYTQQQMEKAWGLLLERCPLQVKSKH